MPDEQRQRADVAAGLRPEELIGAARTALAARRYEEAKGLLARRLAVAPEDVEALCLKALAHWRGEGEAGAEPAQSLLRNARAFGGGDPRVLTLSAELCLNTGDLDAAWTFASEAIAASGDHVPAYVVLARAAAERVDDATLTRMLRLAEQGDISRRRLRSLHNAIGRVLEARGDFDDAFQHFVLSNRLAGTVYEPAVREARLAAARALFDREYFRERRGFGSVGEGCVFIIGMPRSGSTLLEQMLTAHPEAESCGEADAVSDIDAALQKARGGGHFEHFQEVTAADITEAGRLYLAATSRRMRQPSPRRRIDKRLSNFLHLPLVMLMFPDASLLHAHRHPLDVCLSCFTQDFDGHAYANDLAHMAHNYLLYQEYMRLWSSLFPGRIRHCRYETLVGDFEREARAVVAATGLAWHENCAAPHLQRRFVGTASAAQVFEPANPLRIGRWRRYERHLQPLIAGLGGHDNVARLHEEFA